MQSSEHSRLFTDLKQRIELFKMIKRHRKLAEKRSLSFKQNKAAKYILWGTGTFGLLYLCFLAIMFSLIANNSRSFTAVEFICGISPFVLAIDFFFRFVTQEIPAQLIKPYALLPISRYSCIDNFIGTSLLTGFNFTWFAMLVPFIFMSVIFSSGIWIALGILFFYWVLILANSQWYQIARILINDTILWWLLPIGIYTLIAIPCFIGRQPGIESMFKFYSTIGTSITDESILPYLIPIVLLGIVIFINRHLQLNHIMAELTRAEKTNIYNISSFSFLGNLGEIGHYIQLEIKMTLRNKNPRKSFISAVSIVLLFAILLAFTDVYDNNSMNSFFGFYNFVIFGAMILTRMMCNEGNYIDCLMVHKENILSLLKAKYIFYCLILIVPFLLMVPTVITGKWTWLMLFSYSTFTAGLQYFVLFQMAVYNKQTIPLNTKYMSKGGMENNYRQLAVNMACLFIPSVMMTVLQHFIEQRYVHILMLIIGLLFIATSNIWLRNIYNRMMKKKYELLEGFQASR